MQPKYKILNFGTFKSNRILESQQKYERSLKKVQDAYFRCDCFRTKEYAILEGCD